METRPDKNQQRIGQDAYRPVSQVIGEPVSPKSLGTFMSDSPLDVLWRQSWILIGTTVIAVIGGLVYLARATPRFECTSRIYVEQSGPRIMRETEMEGVMTRSTNYLYTQAGLMKATPTLTDAIGRLEIHQMETFRDVDNPVEFLKRKVDVTVGRKDEILSVSFMCPYAAEAANIVNTVVDAYVTFHATRKRSTSAEVLKILQKEKSESETELTEKSRALAEFTEQNAELVFQTDRRGNIIIDKVAEISSLLDAARSTGLEHRLYYEDAKAWADDPAGFRQFIEARQTGTASRPIEEISLISRLQELQRRRDDGLQDSTDDHPVVKAIDAEIAKVQGQINQLDRQFAQAHLAAIEHDYRVVVEKEKQLLAQYEEQYQQAAKLNQQNTRYILLKSEWEQCKNLCDAYADRIKELNVTEDTGALNIMILEAARPTTKPVEPKKARVMAIVLIMGLMAGGGLSLLHDTMDHRLRSPKEEVAALLGTPLLGVVPAMSRRESASQRGQKVALESTSHVAEAFRTVRTGVFFSIPQDQARTIQVTSSMLGEGKSTIVSNLGIAMAQSGKRVLIVDADLRRPTQHMIFGVPRETGLTAVLAGLKPLREVIVHTATPGLDLLPCGPDAPNPAEMLGSRTFKAMLERLKTRYHRIIVDSPPVSPVADASILAAVCDATLFVAHAQKSTCRGILQAKEALTGVGGRIIGGVINDMTARRDGYSYGYGDAGYYRHSGGNGETKAHHKATESPRFAAMQLLDRARGNV